MSLLPDEHPVRLEKLDDHLKAILKIKIREFVHLNPIFNCIPSIDVESYSRPTDEAVQVVHAPNPMVEDLPLHRGMLSQLPEATHGPHPSTARAYFAGFDIDCPNKYRLTPARRRHLNRAVN